MGNIEENHGKIGTSVYRRQSVLVPYHLLLINLRWYWMNLFFCWPTHFNCVLIFSGSPHEIHSTSGRFLSRCFSNMSFKIHLWNPVVFPIFLKISIKITHEFHENPTFPRCLLLEFPGFSRIFHGNHLGNPRKSQEIPPFLHPKTAPKWPRNGPFLCCAATAAVSASAVASAALARSACKGQRRGKNGEIYLGKL